MASQNEASIRGSSAPIAVRTFLFALLDDCSRLVPHGQYYDSEKLGSLPIALKRPLDGAAYRRNSIPIMAKSLPEPGCVERGFVRGLKIWYFTITRMESSSEN